MVDRALGGARKVAARVRLAVLKRSPVRVHSKPDFLIIGAQKAGTTSLYGWMAKHPDMLAARTKELHFFDSDQSLQRPGAYWAQFPTRLRRRSLEIRHGRPVVTGEATPYYLFHPLAPARAHRLVPHAKLIVLVRDPAQRAISHYWHAVRAGGEDLPLEEALARERERIQPDLDRAARGEEPSSNLAQFSYVARGRYAEQLERWMRWFDRSQLLVLRFEDMVADPPAVYRRALEFVGLDPDRAPPLRFNAWNVGENRRQPSSEAMAVLRQQLAEANETLAERFGIDYNAVPS